MKIKYRVEYDGNYYQIYRCTLFRKIKVTGCVLESGVQPRINADIERLREIRTYPKFYERII